MPAVSPSAPREAARESRLAERLGRLLTSMPPMTAKPRTTIRGEPGMIGTSRSRRSRPPMNEKPRSSTSNPSGTTMSMPPQKAKAVISTSGPSISACRRSMSQPPITAMAFVLPLMRQRPLVVWPLMTATCHRRFALAGVAVGSGRRAGAWGRSAMTASRSPRVLAARVSPTRSENSSSVSLPSTTCSRSCVTVRSRSASATRSLSPPAPRGGRRGGSGTGRSAIPTVCPLRPGGGRPDDPSDPLPAPIRLVGRARHHQCGGLRALPAAHPGGHRLLHGGRRREGHPRRGVP